MLGLQETINAAVARSMKKSLEQNRSITIGLDFDNTIVSYDNAISLLSADIGNLPPTLPRNKLAIRNFLRREGREAEWTRFQGELYGPGMKFAKPFDGSIGAITSLARLGYKLVIISHRSRYPYAGPPHDLHKYANNWISQNLLDNIKRVDPAIFSRICFLETSNEKIEMIARLQCLAFVDDLPEILRSTTFPPGTRRVLFSPTGAFEQYPDDDFEVLHHWNALPGMMQKFVSLFA